MLSETTKQTESTLKRHGQALISGDIDAILSDYTEDSVMYTPGGPVRGLAQLREAFVRFVRNLPPDFWETSEMVRQDVEGEVGYNVWRSEQVPLGTNTFIVRDGKIMVQTFVMYVLA